jgi:hypothetical protein
LRAPTSSPGKTWTRPGPRSKGVLRAAVGQPGFVLAQPSSGKMQKEAQPVQRNAQSQPQKSGKQRPLHEVLTQILKKSTKPMTGSELAAEALKAGYHSTSKNFVDVVWVAMSNLKNVERVPNQGYRLKSSRQKQHPHRNQSHRR